MRLFSAIPSLGRGEKAQLAYIQTSLATVEARRAGALVLLGDDDLFFSNDSHQRLL